MIALFIFCLILIHQVATIQVPTLFELVTLNLVKKSYLESKSFKSSRQIFIDIINSDKVSNDVATKAAWIAATDSSSYFYGWLSEEFIILLISIPKMKSYVSQFFTFYTLSHNKYLSNTLTYLLQTKNYEQIDHFVNNGISLHKYLEDNMHSNLYVNINTISTIYDYYQQKGLSFDLDKKSGHFNQTLLHRSVEEKLHNSNVFLPITVMKKLLELGASPYLTDSQGRTPLDYVRKYRKVDFEQELLKYYSPEMLQKLAENGHQKYDDINQVFYNYNYNYNPTLVTTKKRCVIS